MYLKSKVIYLRKESELRIYFMRIYSVKDWSKLHKDLPRSFKEVFCIKIVNMIPAF